MAKKNRNKKEQFDDYLDEKQFWNGGKRNQIKRDELAAEMQKS